MSGSRIFYDVEASGIAGYPIEVGWAIVSLDKTGAILSDERGVPAIATESHLIYCEAWVDESRHWNPAAERLHGISRGTLMTEGKPVDFVAERLNEVFGAGFVYSDRAPFDDKWTAMLFEMTDPMIYAQFRVVDVARAFEGTAVDEHAFERGIRRLRSEPTTHRAAADALRWARLFTTCLEGRTDT